MRRALASAVTAALALLSACSSQAPPQLSNLPAEIPADLLGTWYGNASVMGETGGVADVLTTQSSDGRFHSAFRVCRDSGVEAVTETGTWSVRGDIETSVTLTLDGQPVPPTDYYVERYRLKRIDADNLEKTSLKEGKIFRSRRVSADFQLPADLCKGA